MASKYSMNDRPSWPRRAIVTAGEPYGNKGLHFGHVGGVFVPADFFARFLRDRLGRENVIFTSGTDCYGSPIMESYRKLKENEGYDKSIGEYVESNHSRQAATLNNYNISCDIYGGSGLEPAAQIHNEVTAEIIERLHEQGTISKRSTLQFYDAKAGTFLNGRQVIGRCPIQGCKSEKAYADECDLGHQFEPEELIAPKSQLTGEVPELRPVDNLYFDLPAYLDFMKTYTAKLAQNPQVRSVVSKTMEEWLLPAQLYIQNKFREAFDAVEDQLPEHTVLEPEGNKSSFTVTFPSWKERDDAHAVLANGGVRFRSGKALVPFRITGNIDWGVPVPEVDGVSDVTCWCWPREPVGAHQLYAYRARTRCQGRRRDRGRRRPRMPPSWASPPPIPRRYPLPPTSTARSTGATGGALTTLRSTSSSARTTSTSTASRRPPCGRPWVGTSRRAPSAPAITCSTWAKSQLVLADASPAGRRPAQPLHLRADARALAVARPVRKAGEL